MVDDKLVKQISYALRPDEGESLSELLPELQKLSYHSTDTSHPFLQFTNARLKAGHPVGINCVPYNH